jgi:undecaprenyl phosphate-alpha-L-ara4FN deformylase
MGRHLFRLLRPAFFWKMLRSKAGSLYGWDILLRGTFGPGPGIGKRLGHVIRDAAAAGHEVGLHAWDHHAWQAQIDTMNDAAIARALRRGFETLGGILGRPPTCSAAPGWKCTERVLLAKEELPFLYNSDCRGQSIFRPVVEGRALTQPQVPVTLPTYDEAIGKNGITNDNYNEYILSLMNPGETHVLTIHAEVEGIICHEMFGRFLEAAKSRGISFVPLERLIDGGRPLEKCNVAALPLPQARLVCEALPGREGWVACQGGETKN